MELKALMRPLMLPGTAFLVMASACNAIDEKASSTVAQSGMPQWRCDVIAGSTCILLPSSGYEVSIREVDRHMHGSTRIIRLLGPNQISTITFALTTFANYEPDEYPSCAEAKTSWCPNVLMSRTKKNEDSRTPKDIPEPSSSGVHLDVIEAMPNLEVASSILSKALLHCRSDATGANVACRPVL